MDKTYNILIVDDEKTNIDIILDLFGEISLEFQVNLIAALNGEKALKVLGKRKIDLVLLDIVMPGIDGYEVCKKIKENPKTKNIPVLFITANTDDQSILKGYEVGAVDYVTKPFRSVELISRVKINLNLQQTIHKLEYMAYYDPLTDLYNRRKFFELSSALFESSKENLYAVMVDIDKFKLINDKYGHSTGDKVIKAVSKTLKEYCEERILGRLGGEEFAIVCNARDDEEMFTLIETIRKQIENETVKSDQDDILQCTISSGIASYDSSIISIDHLLQKADDALYEAKGSGRNKSIFRV